MAYRINSHIINGPFDLSVPRGIKSQVFLRAFQIPDFSCTFFEVDYDLPHNADVSPPHQVLNKLTAALAQTDSNHMFAHSFNASLVELNQIFSRDFNCPVLSIDSDDDLRNITVESNQGVLRKLRCLVGDLEIVYSGKKIHIYPLELEMEDDPGIDLMLFTDPAFVVHPKQDDVYHDLHKIALEETKSFLNTKQAVIGLGQWDIDEYASTDLYRRNRDLQEEVNDELLQASLQNWVKPWWKVW